MVPKGNVENFIMDFQQVLRHQSICPSKKCNQIVARTVLSFMVSLLLFRLSGRTLFIPEDLSNLFPNVHGERARQTKRISIIIGSALGPSCGKMSTVCNLSIPDVYPINYDLYARTGCKNHTTSRQ